KIVAVVASIESRHRACDVGYRRDGLWKTGLRGESAGARTVLVNPNVAAGAVNHIYKTVLSNADSWNEAAVNIDRRRPVRAAVLRANERRVLIGGIEVPPGRVDLITARCRVDAVDRDVFLIWKTSIRYRPCSGWAIIRTHDGIAKDWKSLTAVG